MRLFSVYFPAIFQIIQSIWMSKVWEDKISKWKLEENITYNNKCRLIYILDSFLNEMAGKSLTFSTFVSIHYYDDVSSRQKTGFKSQHLDRLVWRLSHGQSRFLFLFFFSPFSLKPIRPVLSLTGDRENAGQNFFSLFYLLDLSLSTCKSLTLFLSC